MSDHRGHRWHAVILACCIGAIVVLHALAAKPVLVEGPGTAIAQASISFWNSGSLSADMYYSIDQHLKQKSAELGMQYWQDVYVETSDGRLLPKHSPLLAVIAAPFYGIFGTSGFLLCNVVIAFLCFLSILKLVEHFSSLPVPYASPLLLFALTQSPFYIWGFSHDLLGAFCILGGLALSTRLSFLGGVLIGSSMFVRPSHLIFCLLLAFVAVPHRRMAKAGGILCCLLLYAGIQKLLFNQVFSTWYDFIPAYAGGTRVYLEHPTGLTLGVFVSSWGEKLFGVEHGLLLYNSLLLALPASLWYLARRFEIKTMLIMSVIALLYCGFIFSYEMWDLSGVGNRFLLPSIYLLSIPCLVAHSVREHRRKELLQDEEKT